MARAFVPGHITGIFRIYDEHESPLRQGSIGAGFSVRIGTVTSVRIYDSPSNDVHVKYNGKVIEAPVTRTVIDRLLKEQPNSYRVEVSHDSSLPIGVGFGASGAGALGTALSLSSLLGINEGLQAAGIHAHIAEVLNHTGLGDVISQCAGGMETRIEPGAPGTGLIRQIDLKDPQHVVLAGRPGLETREVLTNPAKRERINKAGDALMQGLIRNPSLESFIKAAKQFTKEIGLETSSVESALDLLQEAGFANSSMVMLGDSVFSFCDELEIDSVVKILREFWNEDQVIATSVSPEGGRLV